ncbi:MAG TPA: ribbon-helix-helix domain-containing protein [Patescibacteria group bacterium]|nr:ribbon-helix-helix domain-containing protein [Patescibacteria group bacterium]
MRCVVTLSLPEELCREMDKQMKKNHFSNKSEFMRHIFRYWLAEQKNQKRTNK